MGDVTKLDFSRKKPPENNDPESKIKLLKGIGEFSSGVSRKVVSICAVQNIEKPIEKQWDNWAYEYREYITKNIITDLCEEDELYFNEKVNNEIIEVSVFFMNFFQHLFFIDDEGV